MPAVFCQACSRHFDVVTIGGNRCPYCDNTIDLLSRTYTLANDKALSTDGLIITDEDSSLRLTFSRHAWGSRYELEQRMGEGGMGIVFAARHKVLSHRVAIKILRAGRSTKRFLQEARILAKLKSPHLVSVIDYDVLDDGRPMLCMEWVGGEDLDVKIRRAPGKISEADILPWMKQTAIGMRDAATQGIVHRDLKPANILFDEKGQVRVADFGVAQDAFMPSQTTESLLGTVFYMAPEQAGDPRSVDTRADVYSYGATYYHVVTGLVPFNGPNLFHVLAQHQTHSPTSVRFLNENLSESTAEIIERCLAKSPSDRFQCFDEVLRALGGESPTALWFDEADSIPGEYYEEFLRRKEKYLTGEFTEDVFSFPKNRRLRIVLGNIAEQKADALVSSDDSQLTMGGGVSSAIATAAGPSLWKDAGVFVPVRAGRAVVTGAGNLPARFVMHAVTIQITEAGPIQPSRDVITEAMRSCFYQADTLSLRSIVFPLLGCGLGGFSKSVCLDMMFRFVARAFLRGITSLDEVTIAFLRSGEASEEWYKRLQNK